MSLNDNTHLEYLLDSNVMSYPCQVCHETFQEEGEYDEHMHLHFHNQLLLKLGETPESASAIACNEYDYSCPMCNATFREKYTYDQHLKTHDVSEFKPVKKDVIKSCELCGQVFNSNYLYTKHKRQHKQAKKIKPQVKKTRKPRKFKCDECEAAFYSINTWRNHKRTHKKYKPMVCDHCGAFCQNLSSLRKHFLIEHDKTLPASYRQKFVRHRKGDMEFPHDYDDDDDEMGNPSYLQEENGIDQTSHDGLDDQIACNDYHDDEMGNPSNLQEEDGINQTSHDGLDDQIARNEYGDDEMGNPSNLQEEEGIDQTSHDGLDDQIACNEYDYNCPMCKAAFREKYTYEQHLKTHDVSEFKPVKKDVVKWCEICGQFFNSNYLYTKHKRQHKEAKKVKPKERRPRKFKCDECEAGFYSKNTLRNHKRTHKKYKPIVCDHCGAFCQNLSSLRKHFLIEHDKTLPASYSRKFVRHRMYDREFTHDYDYDDGDDEMGNPSFLQEENGIDQISHDGLDQIARDDEMGNPSYLQEEDGIDQTSHDVLDQNVTVKSEPVEMWPTENELNHESQVVLPEVAETLPPIDATTVKQEVIIPDYLCD